VSTNKHWAWGYFITDNQLFRNNHSDKNAWCLACLNQRKELLHQSDVLNTAVSGISSGHTDTDWEAQGSTRLFFKPSRVTYYKIYVALSDCTPISGKLSQSMVPHLSGCALVGPDVRNRALQEINDKKNHAKPPNPPMLARSVSMPLPAIVTTSGSSYPNSGLSTSAMPSGSPSPSPLLLSAPLLTYIDRRPKRARA
jgi:hypothetical protein